MSEKEVAKPKSLAPLVKERDVTMPSGRVVTIKEMTMRDQMMIDRHLTEADERTAMYYRIIGTVVAIDGIIIPEIDAKSVSEAKQMLDMRMENLTASEFTFLLRDYMEASGYNEIKN